MPVWLRVLELSNIFKRMSESLKLIDEYRNTREGNNKIWRDVTKRVDDLPTLKDHRDFVEGHGMGFGCLENILNVSHNRVHRNIATI